MTFFKHLRTHLKSALCNNVSLKFYLKFGTLFYHIFLCVIVVHLFLC